LRQGGVVGQQVDAFHAGLRQQQAVERVFVQTGQAGGAEGKLVSGSSSRARADADNLGLLLATQSTRWVSSK
jgi:hypothetical protein